MAFDSGFFAASLREIRGACVNSRVEKIYMPQADEVDIHFRSKEGNARLCLRCGANDARVALTRTQKDNPPVPPNFCMLLRKHLGGSVLLSAEQQGFERVAVFVFGCRDELGYDCERRLYAEITGRNSNLIFTDGEGKILGAMRIVDFSTSRLRQILPGMRYELPPAQEGKRDPRGETTEGFLTAFGAAEGTLGAAKWLGNTYQGICPAVAREAVFRASGTASAPCEAVDADRLAAAFLQMMEQGNAGTADPVIAFDGEWPVEYSYLPLLQYGAENLRHFAGIGEAMDFYYGEKDRAALVSSRASDLQKTVNNAVSRLRRKLDIQGRELAETETADELRRDADLIVANLYQLKRGDTAVRLTDYADQKEDGTFGERTVHLDPLLSPSANAQKLFKKYNKLKTARTVLTAQMALAEGELSYLLTVKDALSRAETGADLSGIRAELEKEGYIRERRNAAPAKSVKNAPVVYLTSGGFTVLCGRNNLQNEEITFRLAEKTDMWFHAKGVPGSHVLLQCAGREPGDEDLTAAAEIAAVNSDAHGGVLTPVDYTEAKNIKKPAGGRPGLVIYHTNKTAYVTPDTEKTEKMKQQRTKF